MVTHTEVLDVATYDRMTLSPWKDIHCIWIPNLKLKGHKSGTTKGYHFSKVLCFICNWNKYSFMLVSECIHKGGLAPLKWLRKRRFTLTILTRIFSLSLIWKFFISSLNGKYSFFRPFRRQSRMNCPRDQKAKESLQLKWISRLHWSSWYNKHLRHRET